MILVISLASQHQLRRVFRGSVSFGQIVNSRVAVGWASWTELAKESWAALLLAPANPRGSSWGPLTAVAESLLKCSQRICS